MFNEELKQAFIDSRKGKDNVAYKGVFSAGAELEEELGKDLATFSVEEIYEMFRRCGFVEPEGARGRLAGLIHYGNYYAELIPGASPNFRECSVHDIDYKSVFAPTLTLEPEQLLNRIAQVYSPDSAQPAIAAFCFAWLGIDCGDAVKLKSEQVDTRAGIIYDAVGNVLLPAMPECIRDTLHIYANTREAIRVQNQTFTVYADDIGYFIKRMKTLNSTKVSGPFSVPQIGSSLSGFRELFADLFGKENAEWATYTNVQRSGNFYRLYQMERAGTDVFNAKNADKVRLCLGKSKRNHKDNMVLYTAYKEIRAEAGLD